MKINRSKRSREQLINNISAQLWFTSNYWRQCDLVALHRIPAHGYARLTVNGKRVAVVFERHGMLDATGVYIVARWYDAFLCSNRVGYALEHAIYTLELQVIKRPEYLSDDGIPINAIRHPEMEMAV